MRRRRISTVSARTPWPIACCASSGIKVFNSALAFSCSRYAGRVRAKLLANSAQAVGRAHVDNANRLDARLWQLKLQDSGTSPFSTPAPEFPFRGDDEMVVKRIRVGLDLDPFAAAGNDREHRRSCSDHPHIVLQLCHVFRGCSFLRK